MKTIPSVCFISLVFVSAEGLAQDRSAAFQQWDTDSDGKVSKQELPEQLRGNFERVDRDRDGFISLAEHEQFLNRSANQTTRSQIPDNVLAHRDIAYVTDGHERQQLDLYLPKETGDQALPLVIWIHGGGWRNGNRFPCPALFLTQHGYAVASLGYRLSDAATFPAQIHDCKSAIRYLRSKAKEFNIDPKRFGVWGSSAGGHLVALVGTSGNASELEGDLGVTGVSSGVQAVCDYFGPTDLLKMDAQSGPNSRIDHDADDSPESKLLGGPLQDQIEPARRANPITYVDRDDPPFFIVHGDADPLVPHQQSEMLHVALESAKVSTQLVIVPGGGHGPFRDEDQLQAVQAFFDRVLK